MKLTIEIQLPELGEILDSGCPVPIARQGETWSKHCLGEMRNERGVYVIHHNGIIKYVGKTDAATMDFGTRLRSEFQQSASRDIHIYPKLSQLPVPPQIMASFYTVKQIGERMSFNGKRPRIDRMAIMFEMAMIVHLDPEFQQHYIESYADLINRLGKTTEMIELLKAQFGLNSASSAAE